MKSKNTKGIILAGGAGTRLYPASIHISKILLPVYDKPMIYYPLSTLMLAGIKDILIISNPDDIDNFKKLLGDGSHVGISIQYKIQYEPKGIADAILIGEDFIGEDNIALILGDNIFYGQGFSDKIKNVMERDSGATVFGYNVKTPEKFGVVEFDKNMKAISLEEKPQKPKSNYAVVGLYFYDNKAIEYAKQLKPSARGELEITDLNKIYLEKKQLNVEILGRGFVWLDTGSFDTLLQASNFVQSMELNAGKKIGCIEEIAIKKGYISKEKIIENMHPKFKNEYLEYVLSLNKEELLNT
ncbi:MAG: glucose-1-phosphate thymidylyltransferase RfbA [Endomicrobiaceae bacterium]|nr:glucose-1-phosphate thymidylyltransferase RfbA [Endomicrobiaceae bacterium]